MYLTQAKNCFKKRQQKRSGKHVLVKKYKSGYQLSWHAISSLQ